MTAPTDEGAAVRAAFERVHRQNSWRGSESVSGPGSAIRVTSVVRDALAVTFAAFGVSSMLDAPCGDFNWMKEVDLGGVEYTGVDVVEEVVEAARENARDTDYSFYRADITRDPLPPAELVLCRDCLVHLSDALALDALENLRKTGAQYLLVTTFYAQASNLPGSTGGWRPTNLQVEPFNLPAPLVLFPERHYRPAGKYTDKALGLWRLS